MSKEKIKLLFDIQSCVNFYIKDYRRSGIFFNTYNILAELSKYEDLDIYVFSDYINAYSCKYFVKRNKELKNLKTLPNCPIISYIYFLCLKLSDKFKKNTSKDKLHKKIIRFMANRIKHLIRLLKLEEKNYIKNINEYDAILFTFLPPNKALDKKLDKIKKCLYIYDLIPFVCAKDFKTMDREKFKKIVEYAERADLCFAISNHTKEDLLKCNPKVKADNVKVGYLGVNSNFRKICNTEIIGQIKQKYKIPNDKKIALTVGNIEERKNLLFTVNNFIRFIEKNKITDLILVIAGATMHNNVLDIIKEQGEKNPNYIYITGYIDDNDMAGLYSMSDFFVYPSLYEGFGLPVLEAMSCGCPVVTSNTTSLPEVIGDAGIQINPKSNEQMQEALSEMYYNENLRKEYIEKGYKRVKMFSWEKCAKIVYENIKK